MTRTAWGVLGVVASVLALSVVGAPPASSAQPQEIRAQRCYAANVVDRKLDDARKILKRNDCLPGGARDGRHYVVKTRCDAVERFGLVVGQDPVGVTLAKKQRLTLWRGVRETDDGHPCPELTDPVDESLRWDGKYEASVVVPDSAIEGVPANTQIYGFRFDVSDGVMTGDFTGTIDESGVSTDVAMVYRDWTCTTPPGKSLTFTAGQDGAVLVTGNAVCVGERTFVVRVLGLRV